MKIIFCFVISIFLVSTSNAKCKANRIWAYPAESTIGTKGHVVLETFDQSQELLPLLKSKYIVYLQSPNHKVRLDLIEINKGLFNLSQGILLPTETLHNGDVYKLTIENLPLQFAAEFGKPNGTTGKLSAFMWKAIENTDHAPPLWKSPPALIDKTYEEMDEQSAVYAVFGLNFSDESYVFAKQNWLIFQREPQHPIIWPLVNLVVYKLVTECAVVPLILKRGRNTKFDFTWWISTQTATEPGRIGLNLIVQFLNIIHSSLFILG